MSVAISWANKMQLAKCDIMVGFPISSHIMIAIIRMALHIIIRVSRCLILSLR